MNGSAIAVETPLSIIGHAPFAPGKTIQEYYDEQGFPQYVPVVFSLNGSPVLRKDWNRALSPTDSGVFIALPQREFISVLAQIAVTVGVALATGNLAVGIAAGLAVGTLLNFVIQPKVGGDNGNEASPTYSIQSQGNQARLLNPIPRGYGLHNLFMDFAAQPYTTFEGNDQYLFQLFVRGVGFYDTQTIRIGDTDLWRKNTGFTDSFEDVEIELIEPGQPVTLFPAAVQSSSEVANIELAYNDRKGGYVVNAAGTQINRIAIDSVFANGLFDADKAGKLKRREVAVVARARRIDNTGVPLGEWFQLGNELYSAATATPQRYTNTYEVPLGRYEVDRVRTSPDATGSDVSDKVVWAGLRGFEPSSNVYPDVSLLAVKIKATNQLSQQSSRLFNVIQIAKLPVWDGTSWSAPQPTRSIAWAAADMLRNPTYGEGRQDSLIDLAKLQQLDAIWAARGDTFNGVFDTRQTFWDALASVLMAGRSQPQIIAGTVTFIRDEPRLLAKGVFSPHNMAAGSFSTNHVLYTENTPDDVIVEYTDERTWKPNEVQCTLPGSSSESPTRIKLFGITNYAQAWREGMYYAAANAYRRISGSLTTEMEGKLLVRGDAVIVSHDMPKWGATGEVVDYIFDGDCVIVTSEPCNWNNGPFSVVFADRRNRQWGPVRCVPGEDDFQIVIEQNDLVEAEANFGALDAILVTDPNKIVTRYIQNTSVQFSKRFITTAVQPQGNTTVGVGLIVDDPRVYVADVGVPPEEPSTGGLGRDPSAPALEGLRVTLDPSSGASPVLLAASWSPARGATSYVAQYSYDGASFDTFYEGSGTSATFLAQANDIIVRAAAIGTVRGPWAYVEYDFDPENKVPGAVADLSVTVSSDQSVVNADWFPGQYASAYTVELIVEEA